MNDSTIRDFLACRVMECANRDEWLAARPALGLGASQSAGLFPGVQKGEYGDTPYSLYAKFSDPIAFQEIAREESEQQEYGNRMEIVIIEVHGQTTGHHVVPWPQTNICVRDDLLMFCTPDAIAFDDDGPYLVEIKTRNEHDMKNWEERVPLSIEIQVQHQMTVTGIHRACVRVIFGNRIRRTMLFWIEYNPEFAEVLKAKVAEFFDHVNNEVPPEVDSSPITTAAIVRLHPEDTGETVDLPDESDDWLEKQTKLKERIKAAEEELTLVENTMKATLGDATYGVTPTGCYVSWKTQERKEYVVKAAKYRVLRQLKGAPK